MKAQRLFTKDTIKVNAEFKNTATASKNMVLKIFRH